MTRKDKIKVLFVCLGNICRSPSAQAVFTQKVQHAGLEDCIEIDSAGTAAYHIGKAPDARAMAAAKARGYSMEQLRARQVKVDDFHHFDYILAMDFANQGDLQELQPNDSRAHLSLMLDGVATDLNEVPDPYYGGDAGFETVLDLLEQASDQLIETIQRDHL